MKKEYDALYIGNNDGGPILRGKFLVLGYINNEPVKGIFFVYLFNFYYYYHLGRCSEMSCAF